MNATELSGTNITVGGKVGEDVHATLVAAIITKMAPAAELYCTTVDNFYANIEWLISSGVSVINFSGDMIKKGDTHNTYGTCVRWVDHVVFQHGVSWVNSAGNGGTNAYVSSPGNGYNVIAVGGIDDKGTVSTSDDTYFEDTSQKTGNGLPSKPDVVAPAKGFSFSDGKSHSGTSFAAPYVTGMIAQMMSLCPDLKIRPEAVKAAVMASCNRKTSGERIGEISNKEGAGVVNAYYAVLASINIVTGKKSYYDTTDKKITYTYTASKSGKGIVVISWLEHCAAYSDHTDAGNITAYGFPDLDLFVYDSSGKEVARSQSSRNSVEMASFNAIANQTYTVVIERKSTDVVNVAIAHSII